MTTQASDGLLPDVYLTGSTDPFLPSGMSPDDYVGVPVGYQAVTGYSTIPSAPHFTGTEPTIPMPQYEKPIYQYQDVMNLAGNTPAIVAQQQMLFNIGYLSADDDFRIGILDETTISALQEAMGDANRNGMTLEELYDQQRQMAGTSSSEGLSSSSSSSSGADYSPYTNTATSTSSSITTTTRAGARAYVVQMMATELGREPTPKEVGKFLRRLNAKEEDNPSVTKTKTTTTTDPSPSGDSTTDSESTSTTKPSKVDAAREAEKYVRGLAPAEHERFARGNYMDVINQMLGM